jgi:asparagine synthase (glutamine-hydrolysing)
MQDLASNRLVRLVDATDPDFIDELDNSLRKAVRMRMVADVPLGAFLSGGIDSSLVVALMQAQSSRPVKTFTIGFWDAAYNEAADAARVARHLGTEHHEYYISNRDCLDMVYRIPDHYDEPFADSSQIPTAFVAQFASRHVSVALSGDAGDEFWGGYNRYVWTSRLWPRMQQIPRGIRRVMSESILLRSPEQWDAMIDWTNRLMPQRLRVRGGGAKMHKLALGLTAWNTDEMYRSFVSQWQEPGAVVLDSREPPFLEEHFASVPANLNYVERMMYSDVITYLPGDILCKVDRATMAFGLEARVPFLDNDLADLAWSVPSEVRIHRGVSKWPLRQVLKRYIPELAFERPKIGFGIPIGEWMRGPLKDWVEDTLSEDRLRADGFFQPKVVRREWEEHLSGKFNRQHSLWAVLMFQSWFHRTWR